MTNKLVVIINRLKVPNIKTILLYEIIFIVPNYSCLQNPSIRGYRPHIPVLPVVCPQLNLLYTHENILVTPLHEIRLHYSRFKCFRKIQNIP